MAGEDVLLRAVLFMVFVNIVLMIGGFSSTYFDSSGVSTTMNSTTGITNQGVGITGVYSIVTTTLNLVLGGGIAGLFYSAGMPQEFQWMVGAPMIILVMYALLPFFLRTAGGLLKIFGVG